MSRLRDVRSAGQPTPAVDISGGTTVGVVLTRSELRSDSSVVLSPVVVADVPVDAAEDLDSPLLKTEVSTHNNNNHNRTHWKTKRVRRAPDRLADLVM